MCRLSGSTYSGLFMLWIKRPLAKEAGERDIYGEGIFDEGKG